MEVFKKKSLSFRKEWPVIYDKLVCSKGFTTWFELLIPQCIYIW